MSADFGSGSMVIILLISIGFVILAILWGLAYLFKGCFKFAKRIFCKKEAF